MSDNTHGGPRPGAGRKPGQGTFAGGRPVSTRKLKNGQMLVLYEKNSEGHTRMTEVRIDVISRTRIEFVVTDSNAGLEAGHKFVLIS